MAELRVDGLSKRFGAAVALDGVDLSIRDGAFVALLGPSGCGKTTFLRLLAGLEAPSAGTIRIGGADVTGLPPERRGLGMMFQSYALFPHMTVAGNLRFPLRMRALGDRAAQEGKVREALRLVRLEGLEDRHPRQLSGGQQQRVALARALVADPPVLLLDEPLSNLDAQLRKDMQVELMELHRKIGLTTILVTHDQDEALSLADFVVLMRAGRIEQAGPPREIYARPATAFAARFLGAANVVPAMVDGARQLVLRQEELSLRAAPLDGEASLPARVVAIAFHGPGLRVVVEAGPHRLDVLAPPDLALRPGDAAMLCWQPGKALLL
jgi:ABC-type Fe3+/spermidine/putrescine transport system ATPase subunit